MKQLSLPIAGLLVSCIGFSIILVSANDNHWREYEKKRYRLKQQLLPLIKKDANKAEFLKIITEYFPEASEQSAQNVSDLIPFTIKNAQELKGAEIDLKQYHDLIAHQQHGGIYKDFPLHIAMVLRKPNAVRALLELLDPNNGDLPAMLFGDSDDVVPGRLKWFLDNNIITPNWRNGYGTLLMHAGSHNQPQAVRILLEAGADPDLTVDGSAQMGTTPFDNTATFRNSLDKYSDRVQKAWNDFKAGQKEKVNEQLRRHQQQLPEGDTSTPHTITKDIEGLIEGYYK